MNQGRIEIKYSKNGHPIPFIDGRYLHSSFDPIAEAQNEISTFEDKVLQNKNILFLGLGFGYHIDECYRLLSKSHKRANIFVLEPNKELIIQYQKHRSNISPHLFTHSNTQELFNDREFLDLLLSKPLIIPHRSSFKANSSYYTAFLKHRSSGTLQEQSLSSSALQRIPSSYMNKSLESVVENIKNQNSIESSDFFILATQSLKSFKDEDLL